jgi:hypothetical protein
MSSNQKKQDQEEELSNSIKQAMTLREEFAEDSVEELLAALMASNVMEDICQHLFTQESRKAQNAAEILKRG